MKKIVLILMFVTVAVNGQWVQVNNGLGNRTILALTASGDNLFAGATTYPGNGVYLSTNNGTNWTQTLNNQDVLSIAVNGNNVYAGTYFGIYLSTNGGINWIHTALSYVNVSSFAINGNLIFAGTLGQGVYYTTNNWSSWTQTNNQDVSYVFSLALNENRIFAGTNFSGIYLTSNNGTIWKQTNLNNRNVYSFAVNGNRMYAGTFDYGVYVSTNNGAYWTQTTLNNYFVRSIAAEGNNVFAGTPSGVLVSNNKGSNWIKRNEGLGNDTVVRSLCILNNYIFAGTSDNGVFRRQLGELTAFHPISTDIPNQFSLSQNYPNPFNPSTKIEFRNSKLGFVTLKVFDVLGRELVTLVNEQLWPGTYEVDWDGSNFSSGIYYYTLSVFPRESGLDATGYTETKKMVLMK